MAPLTLYYWPSSSVSRAVLMTIKNLGDAVGEYEIKIVNLFKGEQYENWYKNINPQSAVPVIDDNGFVLNESRAIAAYLVNSRAEGSTLYPKDVRKRALVDARLYFEATAMFPVGFNFFISVFAHGNTETKSFKEGVRKSFGYLNQYLIGNTWIIGDDLTIADFFLCTDVASILALQFPLNDFPEIRRWFEQCKSLPGFTESEEGAQMYAQTLLSKLNVQEFLWD